MFQESGPDKWAIACFFCFCVPEALHYIPPKSNVKLYIWAGVQGPRGGFSRRKNQNFPVSFQNFYHLSLYSRLIFMQILLHFLVSAKCAIFPKLDPAWLAV